MSDDCLFSSIAQAYTSVMTRYIDIALYAYTRALCADVIERPSNCTEM